MKSLPQSREHTTISLKACRMKYFLCCKHNKALDRKDNSVTESKGERRQNDLKPRLPAIAPAHLHQHIRLPRPRVRSGRGGHCGMRRNVLIMLRTVYARCRFTSTIHDVDHRGLQRCSRFQGKTLLKRRRGTPRCVREVICLCGSPPSPPAALRYCGQIYNLSFVLGYQHPIPTFFAKLYLRARYYCTGITSQRGRCQRLGVGNTKQCSFRGGDFTVGRISQSRNTCFRHTAHVHVACDRHGHDGCSTRPLTLPSIGKCSHSAYRFFAGQAADESNARVITTSGAGTSGAIMLRMRQAI